VVDALAHPAWWVFPFLFFAALFAGTMDTMAGGGGLITVPILMSLGWSPQDALGTNKFQASFGSGSATLHFARARAVTLRECAWGVLFTAVGAASGAWAVGHVPADFLSRLIPFLLIAMALYLLFSPRLGYEEHRPRMAPGTFAAVFGLGIGFYDGFFGPGTGSFWVLGFMVLRGFEMRKGTAHTKVMNFTSNIVSLAVFLLMGNVHFLPGLVMAGGQFLGGRLGARLVLARGAKLIRPVFIAVALAIALKLLWSSYLPGL
jgi:uncharacterized membrane protein YfcA